MPAWLFSGYVFMKLWEWIPNQIFEIGTIGYAESLGLMIFLTMIRTKKFEYQSKETKEKQQEKLLFSIIMYYLFSIFIFVIGYIVSRFI